MGPATLYFAQERPLSPIHGFGRSAHGRRCRLVFNGIGQAMGAGLVKIGIARNLLTYRLMDIGSQVERSMVLLGVVEGVGYADETATHRRFASCRVAPGKPWGREWFAPSPDLIDFIAKLAVPRWVGQMPFLAPLPSGTS